MIISTYFALTTLSTAGLGDYYQVSDTERLVGSIYFLSGVALFSFIIGELEWMIGKFLKLDSEVDQQDELEMFFTMLRMFNNGNHIEGNLKQRIENFLGFKWINDKNNYLITEEDRYLFSQLPPSCKIEIYTNFLFKEFLFKFRRFFSFRIERQECCEVTES